MKNKKQATVAEEKGECAPLWIISFADMISLLMAFFVMLLTMSTSKSGKLCNEGIGPFDQTLFGFRRSIAGFGIPEWFGSSDEAPYSDSDRTYYPIGGDSHATSRVIDAHEEKIRRIFHQIERHTKTYKSQIQGRHPDFVVVPITFGKGQFVPDESAKQFLSKFTADLHNSAAVRKLNLYVVGLAPEETDEKQQWILSVRRAQAVADFLRQSLSSEYKWPVYSWGAGPGGDWVAQDSPISKNSQILIAVMTAED